MSVKFSETQILDAIKDIIQIALRKDKSLIELDSRIFGDLGAESLDVLDIRFRIEEFFAFKITDGDVIRSLGENLTPEEIDAKFTVRSLLEYIKFRLKDADSKNITEKEVAYKA
jgi:acyl carrier protein